MAAAKLRTIAYDARYVSDRFTGIGQHAYHLLDTLTQLDRDRRYLIFYHPDYLNTRFDLQKLGERANVHLWPIRLPLYSPHEQFAWPVLLARAGADLFHSPYVMLPLLARTRSVITVHDVIIERYPEYRPQSPLAPLYRPVTQLGTRRADLVFTVSEATSRDIQSYYHVNSTRICVTGSGVDSTFRREIDPVRLQRVRERYGLPDRFILTVGATAPHKNVEVLVDAFAHLDSSIVPPLVIGGKPNPRFPDDVSSRIHAYGIESRVVRPGMICQADLPVVYSLADVFVFPSLFEGFGTPPLEAMACGTPVVASMIPAVSEVVGEAALRFDPRNAQQLATILSRLLKDATLRAALTQRGVERARAFTWDRVALQTLAAYTSIEDRNALR